MESIHYGVAWYQKKIGSYDKQLWEQSVEQKILNVSGLKQAPRRSVSLKLKSELIDVDLVRGSTFSKAKPQVSWTYITHKAFTRVLFFPFFYKWWLQQTSFKFWLFALTLYILQVISIFIFFRNVGLSVSQDEFSLSEVVIPGLLMLILGHIHSQTVLSHISHRNLHRDGKHSRDGKNRKKTFTGYKKPSTGQTSNSYENGKVNNSDAKGRQPDSQGRQQNSQKDNGEDSGISTKCVNLSNGKESHSLNYKNTVDGHNGKENLITKKVTKESLNSLKSDQLLSSSIFDSESHLDVAVEKVSVTDSKSVSWSDEFMKPGSLKHGHESQDSDEPREEESHEEMEPSDDDTNGKFEILSVDKTALDESHKKIQTGSVVCNSSGVGLGMLEKPDGLLIFPEGKKIQLKDDLIISTEDEAKENLNTEIMSDSSPPQGVRNEKSVSKIETQVLKEVVKNIQNDVSLHHKEKKDLYDTDKSVNLIDKEDQIAKEPEYLDSKNFSDSDLMIKSDRFMNREMLSCCDSFSFNRLVRGKANRIDVNESEADKSGTGNVPTRSRSLSGQFRTPGMKRVLKNRQAKCETGSETENDHVGLKNVRGIRRRKIPGDESSESSYSHFRTRRTPSSLKLNYAKESTGISSSEGENSPNTPNDNGFKGTVSSEEWEDRVQSDVTTSTYSSSSCGSGAELSDNDTHEGEEDVSPQTQTQTRQPSVIGLERITSSNLHVINLLQPQPSSQQPPDKVSCMIWEGNECKKVDLTALDIGWSIIDKVDNIPESSDYIKIGLAFSILLGFVPLIFIAYHAKELPDFSTLDGVLKFFHLFIDKPWRINLIIMNGMIQRLCLSGVFFFLLSVADRTFKQRLLYAKHFCYLTSSRRAKKFDMPHFRLNKVRNIKIWLSLRSYLKKRGPQRSVDVIVSASFLITIILLTLMCLQLLKDADTFLDFLCNWELCVWSLALGIYLLRFMTLGLKINKKYRNLSVLITEQINLYLQMEQKPHKKEELMVANNVLKLAEDLLKELESPFKISGVSANPLVYNVTKVVVLSAFSAVLTELLGFKLKLYKIKLKA